MSDNTKISEKEKNMWLLTSEKDETQTSAYHVFDLTSFCAPTIFAKRASCGSEVSE
jgi:hypothetical protein